MSTQRRDVRNVTWNGSRFQTFYAITQSAAGMPDTFGEADHESALCFFLESEPGAQLAPRQRFGKMVEDFCRDLHRGSSAGILIRHLLDQTL